ncbi:hypothetical protein MIND_00419400 [Mycena indigotica]|uniref:Uncharacterized protein n=1 Tax=Mycena indigotica TaxID=2126181 RepID=A0A8H6SW92_9AGAR|nr:uncharacterized protein MIND_00419400 [Mycena indigotica]KAF7306285.1 hypothetical protein MIND_00419400 [Mycena indigotica]
MQRPVISYDDITLSYDDSEPTKPAAVASSPPKASSSKKRKWNNNHNRNKKPPQAPVKQEPEYDDEDDPDSRILTAEEIWDDSALIDAWNAATEEYEALNGPDKGWKSEPVHKSPLWYNVPPNQPPKKRPRTEAVAPENDGDSQPIDFATFVPTYDASLVLPAPTLPESNEGYHLPNLASMPSQDEAFQRALGAMYWGGYWTAVYHCQRNAAAGLQEDVVEEGEDGDEDDEKVLEDGEDEGEENFVPTQR